MKITYHIGDREVTYQSSAVPPIGSSVVLEKEGDELSEVSFVVTDVAIKLFLDDDPNIYEEAHVFLSIDAEATLTNYLVNETGYTSTSTQ